MKLMNKRIISLLLALVVLCGMMPMTVFAAEGTEVTEENLWNGRSAVFVGDSITAGSGTTKTYYQFLEETLGFGSVTAMGVAGSCISTASDYGQSNQPLINRYQSIPSADLIVIFMGTNDYGHETPLGSASDTQDGTFYGALNTIIPALVSKHTSSKIVFVTPLHRYGFGTSKLLGTSFTYDDNPNGAGATLGDYVDALKDVCDSNGVSVIDLYTECTLDPAEADVRTNYMPDGLHPNAAGHEVIAGIMESHIRGYEPVEGEPVIQTELINGNKFAPGNNQSCRASSRINYNLKAGTVITLKNPDVMQWACAKTDDENSGSNLGYFPDSGWSDKETAVVAVDGWVGFTFKYRDETQAFDLTKPLSDYITIEEPHSHTYENGICTGCGVKEWDTDGDDVLEILAIGNSFSVDALQYAYQIAHNLGIEEIAIGNLYIGGCTLETHAANAAGDLGKYTYYFNDNGTWTSTGSYKISTAIESRSWDYISLQQGSPVSGVESSYNEDLTDLIAYVHARSDAKLVWHMTWAYQQNSTHSAFPTYNKDQMTMYNGIVSAVQNKIVTNGDIDLIVPNGTAVQNSRTSLLGDTTTRDGYHMSYDYGRYLTGLLFVKTVTGLPVDDVTYAPSGVDAEEQAIAIESANNAAAKPFEVTQSAFVKVEPEIPDEGYVLLKPELHKGAYWHSINADHYNTLVTDASNSKYFFATIRFTRETLPVGSIIVLENGWQYRPEGWITDTVQSNRVDTTTESYVVVTEEWWSDYIFRGFNISKVGTPSLMSLNAEDIHKVFHIYVPEEKHIHTYSNGICTACGAAQPSPIITQQPVNGEAKLGERYMVEVKAEGEGLKYQWYFRNAGSSKWNKSSVKDNTYDDVMTTARAGREVYCVITDANGNSVTTDIVKLICLPSVALEIVTQPANDEAVLGEDFCVTVEAKGDGLKYQWYFRNAGSDKWYKSSVKDNTYDDVMTKARADREIYCVITDAYGNKVTTDVAKLIRIPKEELLLVTQPTDATAFFGERFCATVEVKGEGLKYQWYYRNAGSDTWHKSGVRDNTYDDVMTKARNGREVYCVITDEWGNTVTTDTVRLIAVPKVELKLLSQAYESAVIGERYCVTVEAEGEGLTYQWYFRNAGATKWYKSGVRDNTYDDVMNKTRAGREVYCVIIDACGNQIITEVVTLTADK